MRLAALLRRLLAPAALCPLLALALVAGCGGDSPATPAAAEPPPLTEPRRPAPTAPQPRATTVDEAVEAPAAPPPPPAAPAPPPAAPPPPPAKTVEAVAKPAGCPTGDVVPVGTARRAFAAVAREGAVAYRTPGGARLASFGPRNVNRYPTLFGVVAKRLDERCRVAWYKVQLPLRPNGTTGWVRAADVKLEAVSTRIVVELSKRRVTLYEDGKRVMSVPAAIGATATPTPTGRYYVNQRLIPASKNGPYGPGAIGISAFSPVLTYWAQGGPIAIHGTNRPDLIGGAVSNGCLRVRNDHLLLLFERTRAGSPVLVRA